MLFPFLFSTKHLLHKNIRNQLCYTQSLSYICVYKIIYKRLFDVCLFLNQNFWAVLVITTNLINRYGNGPKYSQSFSICFFTIARALRVWFHVDVNILESYYVAICKKNTLFATANALLLMDLTFWMSCNASFKRVTLYIWFITFSFHFHFHLHWLSVSSKFIFKANFAHSSWAKWFFSKIYFVKFSSSSVYQVVRCIK